MFLFLFGGGNLVNMNDTKFSYVKDIEGRGERLCSSFD